MAPSRAASRPVGRRGPALVGVAGALKQQGGPAIEQEAQKDGDQPLGSCIITGPGKLGVWTKADSVTSFDDFAYGSLR